MQDFGGSAIRALEVVAQREIEITLVLGVGSQFERALDGLALADGQTVVEVQNRLPVSVLLLFINHTCFQCVYLAWGPVEKVMGLWQALNSISK